MAKPMHYDAFARLMHSKPEALESFYCVMGDELLLRIETVDLIRKRCRDLGFSERISLVLDAKSDWSVIQENLQNTSLFSDQKILEITIPTGKPGTSGAKALLLLAEQFKSTQISDVAVILNLPKLDKTTSATKWAQAILNTAFVIEASSVGREQLPAWIRQRLSSQNQEVDESTLNNIVDKVEGNLFAAHQEILKLGLMYEPGFISAEAINAAVVDVARYDIFQLSHAMLSGDAKRSLKILKGLEDEGEALPLVLAFISREIRALYSLAQAQQEGREISGMFRSLGVFPPRDRLIRQRLSALSFKQIMGLLQHASDIDRLFKGYPVNGRQLNAWLELQRLVIKIAEPNIS